MCLPVTQVLVLLFKPLRSHRNLTQTEIACRDVLCDPMLVLHLIEPAFVSGAAAPKLSRRRTTQVKQEPSTRPPEVRQQRRRSSAPQQSASHDAALRAMSALSLASPGQPGGPPPPTAALSRNGVSLWKDHVTMLIVDVPCVATHSAAHCDGGDQWWRSMVEINVISTGCTRSQQSLNLYAVCSMSARLQPTAPGPPSPTPSTLTASVLKG